MDETETTFPTKIYVAFECYEGSDLYCVGFDTNKEGLLDKIVRRGIEMRGEEDVFVIVPGDLDETLKNANEITCEYGTWICVECLDLTTLSEFRPTSKIVGIANDLEAPISPWLQLLFAVFIGGWTAFWWHIFNGSAILVEYALVGSIAALLSYIVVLLFSWWKQRNV
jgi:hypothetical protein